MRIEDINCGDLLTVTGDKRNMGHEFEAGVTVRVEERGCDIPGAKADVIQCEYLDGSDYWWVHIDDLEPVPLRFVEQAAEPDVVNSPSHYTHGNIEVIDAIEDWGLGFHLGAVIKYVARADHKGKPLEDLRKAAWFIDREIARREREAEQEAA